MAALYPAAVALTDQFDAFLVDFDGVVWIGRDPVPGSPQALNALRAAGKRLVFVTNNPSRLPAAYAERLAGLGVADVSPEQVVTAGVVAARLAREAAGAGGKVYVVGAPALKELVAGEGLELVGEGEPAEAAAVVVSAHPGFDYAELRGAKRALDAGAALIGSSRDRTMPMTGGEWPGSGAVLAAVETATGARAEIAGKPAGHIFEIALAALGDLDRGRVAMVGDRLSSDIAGGHAAGLATVLVLSGTTGSGGGGSEELEGADPAPDVVVDDLAALVG
jgi:phosphoglycolate/pyridoxal phosphate phosphatase family enzyme